MGRMKIGRRIVPPKWEPPPQIPSAPTREELAEREMRRFGHPVFFQTRFVSLDTPLGTVITVVLCAMCVGVWLFGIWAFAREGFRLIPRMSRGEHWVMLLGYVLGMPCLVWYLLLVRRVQARARRALQGRCIDCGHDLRDTRERCPQCGRAVGDNK